MNKGVALLLERRETNPEEFDGSGHLRWAKLLEQHDVLLEYPERKVLRPRTFNKEVFKRVLTGSDLKRKGGGIFKELLPGLNLLFDQEYAKYTEVLKEKDNGR
jgi:hypothetical protein